MEAQKRNVAVFRSKVDFFLRESATKFFLCENLQRQSCKAFPDLSNRAQMVGEGCHLLPEILGANWPILLKKNADCESLLARVASQP